MEYPIQDENLRLAAPVPLYTFLGYADLTTNTSARRANAMGSFRNLGNTCYLNALLHALASVPAMQQWTRQHEASHEAQDKQCTLCDLAKDLQALYSNMDVQQIPRTASNRAHWSQGRFSGNAQQDANDAFLRLLEACEDEDFNAVLRVFSANRETVPVNNHVLFIHCGT